MAVLVNVLYNGSTVAVCRVLLNCTKQFTSSLAELHFYEFGIYAFHNRAGGFLPTILRFRLLDTQAPDRCEDDSQSPSSLAIQDHIARYTLNYTYL